MSEVRVRDYEDLDEQSWLRCRVLGFLDTAYYDDVWTSHPTTAPGLSLVAVSGTAVVGISHASLTTCGATIETVVVHPDHRRTGIASALLDELTSRLRQHQVAFLDAWTRDDAGALAWYRESGFTQAYRYLHVYASNPEEMAKATDVSPGLSPRLGFFHADTTDPGVEAELRAAFNRVHACHRFVASV